MAFGKRGRGGRVLRERDTTRTNRQIRAPKVRVVLDDGEMLGVLTPHEALREAESRGLDLVEISPNAKPPVCKIVDYGKYKYEQKKKNQGQNKKPASSVLKEISLGVQTHDHDIKFKVNHAVRFLRDGHRVKVSIRFRGREMAHPGVGREQMLKFIGLLEEYGQVEANPKMEGRFLHALINPLPAVVKKAAQEKEAEKAKRDATKAGEDANLKSKEPKKPEEAQPSEAAPDEKPEEKTEKKADAKKA